MAGSEALMRSRRLIQRKLRRDRHDHVALLDRLVQCLELAHARLAVIGDDLYSGALLRHRFDAVGICDAAAFPYGVDHLLET